MSSDDHEPSSSWEPVQLANDPHQSLSGRRATAVSSLGLIVFLVSLAGLAAAWFWYGVANSSGIPPWALLVVGVLAAFLALVVGGINIEKGNAMGCLTIAVENWTLTSALTQQAIDELQLKNGEGVTAIFKATDVSVRKA